jgi:uncharacterized protein YjbJ (UPF0337 family)
MNWDQIEGKWKQFKGSAKQKWGQLTDDDLEYIAGKRESLVGKLQERYGLAREEAEKNADEWLKAMKEQTAQTNRPPQTPQRDAQYAGKR